MRRLDKPVDRQLSSACPLVPSPETGSSTDGPSWWWIWLVSFTFHLSHCPVVAFVLWPVGWWEGECQAQQAGLHCCLQGARHNRISMVQSVYRAKGPWGVQGVTQEHLPFSLGKEAQLSPGEDSGTVTRVSQWEGNKGPGLVLMLGSLPGMRELAPFLLLIVILQWSSMRIRLPVLELDTQIQPRATRVTCHQCFPQEEKASGCQSVSTVKNSAPPVV